MESSESNSNIESIKTAWPIVDFSSKNYKDYFVKLGLPNTVLFESYNLANVEEDDQNTEAVFVFTVIVAVKKVKETNQTEDYNLPFFIKNTSNLDKGLVALLNGLGNALDNFNLSENSILGKFFKDVKNLSPEKRAEALENNSFFKAIHEEFARLNLKNDSTTSNYDFLTYNSEANGIDETIKLVEIDGSKNSSIIRRTYDLKDSLGFCGEVLSEIQKKVDDGEILDDVIILQIGDK